MIGKEFPFNLHVDISWSLNGLPKKEEEYIIIEPLVEKAIRNDFVRPKEFMEYDKVNCICLCKSLYFY